MSHLEVEAASFWLCKDWVNSPNCWNAAPASRKISPTEAEVTPAEEVEVVVGADEPLPEDEFVDEVIFKDFVF